MFRLITAVCLVSLVQAARQNFVAPRLDGRIVGGEPTFIEDHPFQASLLYYLSHRCGAVIISEDYLVTAAHCTDGYVHFSFFMSQITCKTCILEFLSPT